MITCKSNTQKANLAGKYADRLLAQGKLIQAAEIYASSDRSFEETTLKLLSIPNSDQSLEIYLKGVLKRFSKLPKQEKLLREATLSDSDDDFDQQLKDKQVLSHFRIQRAVLCAWITELKLNQIEDAQDKSRRHSSLSS